MSLDMRPITQDEFPDYLRALEIAFGSSIPDEDIEAERATFEADRSLAVFDRDRIVGTAGAYSFRLTVPGALEIPVAGVTMVSVLPTHRRSGILRQMMQRQLDDVQSRGESMAVLLASESVIYGRFGYGLATTNLGLTIERPYNSFTRPIETPGQCTLMPASEAITVLPEIYERVRLLQPGAINRSPEWWEQYMRDPERHRDGLSPRFYVAYQNTAGMVDGYVTYRVKNDWGPGGPNNTLVVFELITATSEARSALWQYCMNVDLIRTVEARSCPVDEPLRWMLADPRRLHVTRYSDWLWARLLDIPTALSARRYSTNGDIVFQVVDHFRPQNDGCYSLAGGPDGAECTPTGQSPDLALHVSDLGAAYLGGVSFCTLARAGRVSELTPRALRRADALFTWDPAPWCAMFF